jgi:hypothetical protein
MRLSLTSYILLLEAMRSSSSISYPLSLQQALDLCVLMNMNHHPYMIVLFRDGLIELVAITSGRIPWMIRVVDILSIGISSLTPISMSFISQLIIYLFILMIIMCLNYLCCFT